MTRRGSIHLTVLAAIGIIAAAGCGRDTSTLEYASFDTDPIVFIDDFGRGVQYQAFLWSDLDALDIDQSDGYQSTASLKISVPDYGASDGGFAGGAFVAGSPRDLTGYNALTFYAKASRPEIFDVFGLANDNTGTSKYEASWSNVPLTTSWEKYIIPIPYPPRLAAERGLFYFADAVPEDSSGYTVWVDDVQFEFVQGIANPRPSMATETINTFVGAKVKPNNTRVIFNVDGSDETIDHLPGYFSFFSSADTVAAVTGGEIVVVGGGDATITAKLDTVTVAGTVTVNATPAPPIAAPTPTVPAADVISLFSDAYVDSAVETWAATWSGASWDVDDMKIAGNNTKVYTNLNWAGIVLARPIDITEMTYFHMDVWVAVGVGFKVKLVDFGEDGVYGGAPDVEHELTFTATTTPPFFAGSWVDLEIPMADFVRLTTREHLAQVIITAQRNTVFIDNVYWHK